MRRVRAGTPWRTLRRARGVIRGPGDVLLAARMAGFLLRAPADLQRHDLPAYLERLRRQRRPTAPDVTTGLGRVRRIRGAWLRRPWFRRRNTCYVRALTLYRFLDVGDSALRLHLGVETALSSGRPLRGHAWVTLDGELLEGPPEAVLRRVTEIPVVSERAR